MTASLPTPLGPLMTRIIGCGGGASGSELNVVPSAASSPLNSWSCIAVAQDARRLAGPRGKPVNQESKHVTQIPCQRRDEAAAAAGDGARTAATRRRRTT